MLEVIAANLKDIQAIEESNADRIEFIADGSVGGLTPSHNDIKTSKTLTTKPIYLMIREKYQSFVFTKEEKEKMLDDIKFAKNENIDGVVIGALTEENEIDFDFIEQAISIAKPMKITFHRAFEVLSDKPKMALRLASMGVDFILTNGGVKNPLDGIETLQKIQKALDKTNTQILLGGGINARNIQEVIRKINIKNAHVGTAARDNFSFEENISLKNISNLQQKIETL